MQHQTIERKNTRAMMDRFYSQVLKDDLVDKYYTEELAEVFKTRSRAIANNFIRLLGV